MSDNEHRYCPVCGLEYRKWAVTIEEPVCEECEPLAYGFLHNKNIGIMVKRNQGQQHITEHTWFPSEGSVKQIHYDVKHNKYNRRQQK